ncbi:FAD-dependent oxidoreductase [Streptomyces sp. NPDC021080]|uniref:FAD-dependent oxidoreductase n=1 Tax=Streptomyces sp. NPDC021080 TaxID=3365110 RepID=UPI00379554A4
MNTTTHHPIAVVGGGLGGLTAAAVFHARGIEVPVFEAEAGRHVRTQGGMLDIHAESGQLALQAAGLMDEFRTLTHAGGEATRVLDRDGTVLYEDFDDGSFQRPEIDRGRLRDLLLDALPRTTVRWGSKAVSVERAPGGQGRHQVTLDSGETFTTDLLIGADGAWSKVRPLLTDAWPAYTGISFLEADLHDADRLHPAEAAVMGPGMLFALGGDTGILGHRESDGSLHYYLGHRADEDWIDTVDFTDPDPDIAKRTALELLDGWAPELRALVANADSGMIARRINALPPTLTWPRTPGVTLLGDAAHVMSPFAGEGANLAMFDGSRLAAAVADHPGDTEAALAAYESAMFAGAHASAADSAENLQTIFSDGAAKNLAAMFTGFAQDAARTQQ